MLLNKLLGSKPATLIGLLLLILMTSLYCVLLFIVREQFPVVLFISLELLGAGVTFYLVKWVVKLLSITKR